MRPCRDADARALRQRYAERCSESAVCACRRRGAFARVACVGNGELLQAAETAGFDVLLTTDRNIRYQQNLTGRTIAIVVLGKARWRLIRNNLPAISAAVEAATPGSFIEVEIPID